MRMNRAWIEARIPHQGRMCLLDEVIDWNDHHIRCRTGTHRALDNPLRSHERLGIASGIELALTEESADRMADPQLETLRTAVPAARSLPLMRLLAGGMAGRVVLDYLDVARAALQVLPCV